MMLAVVVGAALVGWLVVRLVAPEPEAVREPETRVAAVEEPDVVAAPSMEPTGGTRAGAPPDEPGAPTPAAALDEKAAAEITRDLDAIAQVLRQDKYVARRAFPADATVLELPGVIQYLRTMEFWAPALTGDGGGSR
jgi:hypothetical protein